MIERSTAAPPPITGFAGRDFAAMDVPSRAPSLAALSWSGRGLAPWQLGCVARHVHAHLDRSISLSELAGLVRLSRFHFCTAFRLATGKTPRNWITDARICRAVELLQANGLTITQIALEVGYETPSAFTARFRQRTGMTPREYRRAF